MIAGVEFSRRGQKPTTFEAGLVAQAATETPWLLLARRMVAELGLDAGLQAFALVLDEFGGEKIRVPERRAFFTGLWSVERQRLIADLCTRPDWTGADIARALGVSRSYVTQVKKLTQRGTCQHEGR